MSLVARAGARGREARDQHQQHHRGGADLGPVLGQLSLRHARPDLPDDPAEDGVALRAHASSLPRFRIAYAMRDWRLHSSVNPGLACCEKRPPDSPKPASSGSYSALGEERATGVALPL